MKKFLPIIVLLFTAYCILYTPVFAEFNQAYSQKSSAYSQKSSAYQDYLYQYDQYRRSLTDFLTAKNRYLTYQTLVSQTEALVATKAFLEARDQVLTVYLAMLIEKSPTENLKKLIGEEITFYTDHKSLIPAVGSLEDSIRVSGDFESHSPQTTVLARQLIAGLLINKVQDLGYRLASVSAGFEENVNGVKKQGKEVATLERWLLETKNKQFLAENKLSLAEELTTKFRPTKSSEEGSLEFAKVQVLIFEANQYLKEAAAYLKEIKEELKYGNY